MPPAEELYAENLALKAELEVAKSELAWFRRQMFGAKSEKLPVELPNQIKLGLPETPTRETTQQKVSYERRKPAAEKRPMPAEVFANLPVMEVLEILPEEVKEAPEAFEKISEERTFEVELIGPKLVKREIVSEVTPVLWTGGAEQPKRNRTPCQSPNQPTQKSSSARCSPIRRVPASPRRRYLPISG